MYFAKTYPQQVIFPKLQLSSLPKGRGSALRQCFAAGSRPVNNLPYPYNKTQTVRLAGG